MCCVPYNQMNAVQIVEQKKIKITIALMMMMMTTHITFIYQTQFPHFNDNMYPFLAHTHTSNILLFILFPLFSPYNKLCVFSTFLWMKEINGYFNKMEQNDDNHMLVRLM